MLKMRLHEMKEGNILAICDEELLGKKYKEGEMVIDLDRYGSFYNGESVSGEATSLEEMAKKAVSINAVGKNSLKVLEELGFDTSGSKKVEGVPHLQVFVIRD